MSKAHAQRRRLRTHFLCKKSLHQSQSHHLCSLNKICWCCSLNRSLGFLVTLFYGTPCEAGVNFSVIQRRPQTAVIRESFPKVYTSDSLLLCFSHSSIITISDPRRKIAEISTSARKTTSKPSLASFRLKPK